MSETTPIQNNPHRNKFQVLIAEDDISISNLLRMQLELAGYKVVVANSGNSAVELTLQNKPNFIIMDISMPELNGFEVIDKLKTSGFDTNSFKLVFLSNSSTPGDIEKSHDYGAEYKIKAELSPKELIGFIDSKLID
ncbi:MAG: response regulator [bacterium]|jgi:CheY-like chemotaxis protein